MAEFKEGDTLETELSVSVIVKVTPMKYKVSTFFRESRKTTIGYEWIEYFDARHKKAPAAANEEGGCGALIGKEILDYLKEHPDTQVAEYKKPAAKPRPLCDACQYLPHDCDGGDGDYPDCYVDKKGVE